MQATRRPFEIIAVDDGGEPPLASSDLAAFPLAHLLRGDGRGPAAARNLGVRAARGPIVLFTDDDTAPDPGWLEAACRFLENRPGCIGVAGVTISPPFDYLYEQSVECDVPAFWTCNVAYRRDALESLGGFCELFCWPHHEDLDLGYRAERLGGVGFAQDMRVVHFPHAVSARELIGRGRLVASDLLLAARHPDRYRSRGSLPRRLVPVAALAREWSRLLRREGRSLVRLPRRLSRFALVATGQLALGFVTALTTSPGSPAARRRR
jgi:GT2 family glycosyltransferase